MISLPSAGVKWRTQQDFNERARRLSEAAVQNMRMSSTPVSPLLQERLVGRPPDHERMMEPTAPVVYIPVVVSSYDLSHII
jgi:hypothetical protein